MEQVCINIGNSKTKQKIKKQNTTITTGLISSLNWKWDKCEMEGMNYTMKRKKKWKCRGPRSEITQGELYSESCMWWISKIQFFFSSVSMEMNSLLVPYCSSFCFTFLSNSRRSKLFRQEDWNTCVRETLNWTLTKNWVKSKGKRRVCP